MKALHSAALLSAIVFCVPATAQELPKRPEELTFPERSFEPPEPGLFKRTLKNGVVAFLAPSSEFPLIDVTFSFKGGRYLVAPGDEGLAGCTVAMLRRGGTTQVKASEFDEKVDFLAADLGVGATDYQITASLNTLKANFEETFTLFMEMLRSPGFQQDKVDLYKAEVLEGLKQRNDRAEGILAREWTALMYGRDHFKARSVTKRSLDGITVEKMRAFQQQVLHPGNLVIGVSGDFETKAMVDRLNEALDGWEAKERAADPPTAVNPVKPGVYRIEKDIPQGQVNIGLRGIQRDHPDSFALSVMSRILGSGGFTSRIMQRVRSDEGLAYSAGAMAIPGLYFPGEIRGFFQSKSRTVALATKLIFEEFARIQSEPVTDDELNVAKAAMIESFPTAFGSKAETISVFINDAQTRRDPGYWKTYREKVQAVTKADIQRVAKTYLKADQMAILVVGKWSEIEAGDLQKRATMAEFFGGKSTELPLRDPLTLEPLK